MKNKVQNLAVFAPLFLVIIIDTMGLGIIFPVLSPLVMSSTQGILAPDTTMFMRQLLFGLILGSYSLFLLLGAPFFGDLSDNLGRKKVLMLCLGLTSVSFVMCALAIHIKSVTLLILGRAIDGFSAGSGSIAQAAIADISTKENKAQNLGLISIAFCVGFAIGPLVGGFFADHSLADLGYTFPFYIAALLTLANMALLFLFFHETHVVKERKAIKLSRGITIFLDAFKHPIVKRLAVVFLLSEIAWGGFFEYISFYLVETFNYTATVVGYYMAYLGLIFTLSLGILLRIFLRFMTVKQLALASYFTMAIFLAVASITHTEPGQWLVVIPIGAATALCYACFLTIFSNSVGEDHQGWIMGVTMAIAAVAWLVSAFAAMISPYLSPFLATAIIALIGSLMTIRAVAAD